MWRRKPTVHGEVLLSQGHAFGAVVMDRRWNLVTMNQGASCLLERLYPASPSNPRVYTNLVHALLHPEGLRAAVVNWVEVAWSLVARLHRELEQAPDDDERRALFASIADYPDVPSRVSVFGLRPDPFLTLHLRTADLELRLFKVLSSFGTPLDLTAEELVVETFFPADEASDQALHEMAGASQQVRSRC